MILWNQTIAFRLIGINKYLSILPTFLHIFLMIHQKEDNKPKICKASC